MTPRYLLLAGCLLALAACEDPALSGAPTPVQIAQDHPATPPPRVLATPVVSASQQPFATPTPTPTPGTPSPAASPDASPTPVGDGPASAAASATPAPYQKTGVATDLAVSGPGYFVLATKPDPASVADLLFTRDGHFQLAHDTAGSLSLWRLRHATYAFYVAGYMLSGGTAAGAPDETSAPDHAELATRWGGQPTTLEGLVIDAERNVDAPTQARFDFTGRLMLNETAPRGPDGAPVQVYVAIAQVADPTQLVAQPGFAGVYKYAPAAGALQLGVATSGDGRPVGNANLILAATLAQETGGATANP